MTFDFFEIVAALERDEHTHRARLLVLLLAFRRTDDFAIKGLTKLAKLDFLLRYPIAFERALSARGVSIERIEIDHDERHSIESEMIRYKYGPWDKRYRKFINVLVAHGYCRVQLVGRAVCIDLTEKGASVAAELADKEGFGRLYVRAKMLKTHLDLTASVITKFVYDTFPELATMRYNEPLRIEDE